MDVVFALLLCAAATGFAATPDEAPLVLPEHEDATLRSVWFATPEHGCAVGDHGVIQVTRDGGMTWNFQSSPVPGMHAGVHFVGRNNGWIVGSRTDPASGLALGYVLATTDGGDRWQLIAGRPTADDDKPDSALRYLPRLKTVRFFTSRLGLAAGHPNRFYPSGVLRTEDGGRSWTPVEGRPGEWQCAWFLNPQSGVVAGRISQRALLHGDQIVAAPNQFGGIQSWRSARLNTDSPSWLVGDGAQVLASDDAGVTWREPQTALAPSLRDFVDFHAVSTVGSHVWIAGAPGSVVWHSPDGGGHWVPFPTGVSLPVRSLHFIDPQSGWAVGDLGVILRTTDGGRSWRANSAGQRRVAMLAVVPRVGRIPFGVLARYSGEHGYRSAVRVTVRPDIGSTVPAEIDSESRLTEAIADALGNAGAFAWQLPIRTPGAEHDETRLVADWQQQTEGRLGPTFLSTLVADLRTYRPDVVLLDHVAPDDAAARLTNAAVLKSVELAASPAYLPEQIRLAGLQPWRVSRVFQRLPAGSRAQIQVTPHEVLRARGTTVGRLAANAWHVVAPVSGTGPVTLSYQQVLPAVTEQDPRADLFRGLQITPNSDARRRQLPVPAESPHLLRLARAQRNLDGYLSNMLEDPRMSAQLVAQLDEVTAELPAEDAARRLAEVADRYSQLQRWELAANVRLQLIRKYPRQPEASAAREWLFHWWAGAEPAWQRLRSSRIAGAQQVAGEHSQASNLIRPATVTLPATTFTPQNMRSGLDQHHRRLLETWDRSAMAMAADLKTADPLRFQTTPFRMSLSALLRAQGSHAEAMAVYNDPGLDQTWQQAAANEIWANQQAGRSPDAVYTVHRTSERPVLDGILSDSCWQAAAEMWLRGEDLDTEQGSFTLVSRDDQFLYLAAAIRRHETSAGVKSLPGGRSYDADLGQHDRVSWHIDTDRDYATWYTLEVDQRGQTTDSCWEDRSWNPKWFVAVDADETHWRMEAAIPLEELAGAIAAGQPVWAIGVTRTLPGYGVSSWNQPPSAQPLPETFGLAVFEQ